METNDPATKISIKKRKDVLVIFMSLYSTCCSVQACSAI